MEKVTEILKYPNVTINARLKAQKAWLNFCTENPDLNQNEIPKSELIKRGFVFMNRVGNAGRAIIQKVYNGNGEEALDFSDKLFLTDEDLNKVRLYTLPPGVDMEYAKKIGEAMDTFINQAQDIKWFHSTIEDSGKSRYFVQNLHTLKSQLEYFLQFLKSKIGLKSHVSDKFLNSTDNKLKIIYSKLEQVLRKLESINISSLYDQTEKAHKEFGEIYKGKLPDSIRGVSVKNIDFRKEGGNIENQIVPFLTEDEVFEENRGIYINDSSGNITKDKPARLRMNTVCAYLAKHGICNTGTPEDFDQRYISLEEFYSKIYLHDLEENFPTTTDFDNFENSLNAYNYKSLLGLDVDKETIDLLIYLTKNASLISHFEWYINNKL